jgi:hypothetical protein
MNYLPGLASNRDPPDLCFLSSWDYRREPLELCQEQSFTKSGDSRVRWPGILWVGTSQLMFPGTLESHEYCKHTRGRRWTEYHTQKQEAEPLPKTAYKR